MKKLISLYGLLFFINLAGYTQTTPGNLLIGGQIRWSSSKNNGTHIQPSLISQQNIFTFTGNFGTFIKDNLAVGILYRQEFESHTQEDFNQSPVLNTTDKLNSFTAGPFLRKYFAISEKISFYTQAMIGYSFNKSKSQDINSEASINKFGYLVTSFQPGLTFFPSNKIGIDVTVPGFEYRFSSGKNNFIGHQFFANLNLPALNLGLNFYLNR